MPDRLPSLVLLLGFWVPPAVAGIATASLLHRRRTQLRSALIHPSLVAVPALVEFTTALVLPGSVIACIVDFRTRARALLHHHREGAW